MEYKEITKEEVDKYTTGKPVGNRSITLYCTSKAGVDMFNKALRDAAMKSLSTTDKFEVIVSSTVLPAPYTLKRTEVLNQHRGVVQVLKYNQVIFTCWMEFSALFKSSNPFDLFSRYVKENIKKQVPIYNKVLD